MRYDYGGSHKRILHFNFQRNICLYYLLLMSSLSFLRRHISARACAILWMLPNYLYLTQMTYMRLPKPRWVIEAPLILVQTLLNVWLIGFLSVLGWNIVSHLTFRTRILRDASPITDLTVLAIWRQEIESARFHKPRFKLVTSPNIQTPLSLILDSPEGVLAVTLSDRFLKLVSLYGEVIAEYYYLPDGTDWDALSEYIVERPALNVHITGTSDEFGQDITASLSYVSFTEGDGTEILYEMDSRETPSSIFGYPASQAILSFNLPLSGDCIVEIVPLDGGNSRTVFLNQQPMTLSLTEEPSRYTVCGKFSGKDGKSYRMEFQFEIGAE